MVTITICYICVVPPTNIIFSTLVLLILAYAKHLSIISMHFSNISMFICSLDFRMKVLIFMEIGILQRWPPHRKTTLYWPAHMHCKVSKALLHLRMCWFCIFFKFLPKLAHQFIVKILTSQMGVSSNCLDLDFVLLNAKHDNIEIPSTQIEDKDILTIV